LRATKAFLPVLSAGGHPRPLFPLFSLYFQKTDAAVTYEKLYSRGINISGKLWGREKDNIGIGYGCLKGGNKGADKTQAVEGDVRFGLNEYVALTLDAQYMDDKYVPDEGTNVDGWIVGARMSVEF
jgi:porin